MLVWCFLGKVDLYSHCAFHIPFGNTSTVIEKDSRSEIISKTGTEESVCEA